MARGSWPEPARIPSGRRAAWDRSGVMAVARRAQRALAACAYERDDFLHDRMLAELSRHVLEPLQQRALVGKQQAIGAPQAVDLIAREAAPLQANDIEPRQIRPIA